MAIAILLFASIMLFPLTMPGTSLGILANVRQVGAVDTYIMVMAFIVVNLHRAATDRRRPARIRAA